jgi:hypothetical protein
VCEVGPDLRMRVKSSQFEHQPHGPIILTTANSILSHETNKGTDGRRYDRGLPGLQ